MEEKKPNEKKDETGKDQTQENVLEDNALKDVEGGMISPKPTGVKISETEPEITILIYPDREIVK